MFRCPMNTKLWASGAKGTDCQRLGRVASPAQARQSGISPGGEQRFLMVVLRHNSAPRESFFNESENPSR